MSGWTCHSSIPRCEKPGSVRYFLLKPPVSPLHDTMANKCSPDIQQRDAARAQSRGMAQSQLLRGASTNPRRRILDDVCRLGPPSRARRSLVRPQARLRRRRRRAMDRARRRSPVRGMRPESRSPGGRRVSGAGVGPAVSGEERPVCGALDVLEEAVWRDLCAGRRERGDGD